MIEKIGKRYHWLILFILGYVLVITFAIVHQYNSITAFYYKTTGENAVNMATMAANMLDITDAQLSELENLSFEDAITHPCNQRLNDIFQLENRDESVKYAYVIKSLSDNEIKYNVEDDDAEFYNSSPGTRNNQSHRGF